MFRHVGMCVVMSGLFGASHALAQAPGTVRAFDTRSHFQIVLGQADVTEDFEGFTQDVAFNDDWLGLAGAVRIRQIGESALGAFRNKVDVPPLEFNDNNGTAHASCWTNYDKGEGGVEVHIRFAVPVRAWGADFWGAASSERLDIHIITVDRTHVGTLEAGGSLNASYEFLGFIAAPGVAISELIFKSRTRRWGTAGEGFGTDNWIYSFADCYADCDQSTGPGVLDVFDMLCFANKLSEGDPYACDCTTITGPGVCDIFDFLCFQNFFTRGCP